MSILREHLPYGSEIKDLLIADVVLTLAFALVISGGVSSLSSSAGIFLYFIPISFIAVTLTFVLHELMHKFVAQHYSAIAAFRVSTTGLLITAATSLFGFLVGIPGATVIYTNSFTKKENGIVSIAGPLTNFAIFAIFFVTGLLLYPNFTGNVLSTFTPAVVHNTYLHNMINLVLFISILLAFYNMLPIYPLDGSKVYGWNKGVYVATLIVIFVLFTTVLPIISILVSLVFMLVIAFIFSVFYRGLF